MPSLPWLKGTFHIPDALWRSYEYLDLYPLDGGASFIVDEYVKTRRHREITAQLLRGELFRAWGPLDNLEWTRNGDVGSLELYAWLHRWYFAPSVARISFLTGDEKLAELILRLMSDWEVKMGYPANKEEMVALEEKALAWDYRFQRGLLSPEEAHVPWEWYDFQPAYRLLVLLCTTVLLRNTRALAARSEDMKRWIRGHANSILWVTEHYGYKYGNHHTLRMMCMYLAGALVQDENAERWRQLALEMQTRHIGEDFFEDGMYKESLPGYTPFVLTHFREVLLSAKANGQEVPEIFRDTLLRSLRLLKAMVMPDGYLPVINDGPRVDITATLALMEHYYPIPESETKTFYPNKPSGFPIFRDERNYLLFDANYAHGSHVQAGKLGFVLWRDKDPFIIEGGCCNYDNPDFQPYFRRGWAHSTLLVDGQEDAVWKSFWVWAERAHPVIKAFSEGKHPSVCAESDGFKRLGVTFSRSIDHPDIDTFRITDDIRNTTGTPRTFTFRFILAQEDVQVDAEHNRVLIKSAGNILTLEASLKSTIQVSRAKSNFFGDMREVPCVDFIVKSAGDVRQSFSLAFSEAH